ncbi:MAG: tRNA (adenosine(37)-N6)-threonylcarbamoyltransferase complex transferase subunit TsaD [Alphaproteobacteria bacterium]|jgi:N6-L-threonylcarbamoyladenine synthase|nr:tRNA (adenosine(37)-N6)-threonylcarbamoyltransferase complex transferase subunit TsaD [Rhodospirillaceae bacterium]MDP6020305.1 tRNA (adenosine(37)-N6)-threonylcarbamoyltransferase complex transferase subunit TsaD [Alphaproteobacteria bacterium]MDP6256566.1 tRNA (adenosine(37)-N6)-threonylcarbamoyltransferase complex transferase subunit TsaD [Alphaproteobacteria bacterium]MDP7055547.1 tRNA (adenosine(37)-N6)-threonylcarbamoyltransferase complex transferase subunit TsaD [Alphaproteobacteria ba|tara:strand:+ start:2627 stop:3670 length:1044 start_codon:yes stop_codon:yes gene_type:complete
MIVLGIETSCDETAAAVVDDARRIRSNIVLSQVAEHRPYGGVVPEIAARAHVEQIDGLIRQAVDTANLKFSDLDGVAATAGPGLIGGVMVGLVTGKAIAAAINKPLLAINHLEGHALSARLTDDLAFPYLLLLVSGGHCQLLLIEAFGRYRRLGTTIDDAVGEAFDKVAKMLDLGYPGGPAVQAAAERGNPDGIDLPRPMAGRQGCDFSFSGLKTAVRRLLDNNPGLPVEDVAAAFQTAVGDVMVDRAGNAIAMAQASYPGLTHLVIAGGVAANSHLRQCLDVLCRKRGLTLAAPPVDLCTDNGAMIAWAGVEHLAVGLSDPLDTPARARWPLDPDAKPMPFAGKKA